MQWIARFFRVRNVGLFWWRPVSQEKKRSAVAKVIGKCPSCDSFPKGHAVAQLSYVIVAENRQVRLNELQTLLDQAAWERLLRLREWDRHSDVVELLVLKCPNDCLMVLTIEYPFELWSDDRVLSSRKLSPTDSVALGSILEDQWIAL